MSIKVGLGQINTTMGDFGGNIAKMADFYHKACDEAVDLLVFPELALCGYPPEDLLHKPYFLKANQDGLVELCEKFNGQTTVLVGFAESIDGKCYNSAAYISNGKVEKIYRKVLLPNYGVFDEKRYFQSGNEPLVLDIKGAKVVVTICEDIWDVEWLKWFLKDCGQFDAIVNLSGSPFHKGKVRQRHNIISECARQLNSHICYCNLVGGQDELVFDGQSLFVAANGEIKVLGDAFEETLLVGELTKDSINPVSGYVEVIPHIIEEIYRALVIGTRDYVNKNGFNKVVIGISGGIDSALVAAIAVAALGKNNVIGITMPSRFNKDETISDAKKLAENLGIEFHTIPIESAVKELDNTLSIIKGWDNKDIAFENLQSRVRGIILMSLSNKFGCMVLTTGNKSETAVGYSTLYGDTAGGFAVIKDVPKTLVYTLCEYINVTKKKGVIPESIIQRPPSAELRENQFDSDSLPDYDLLDKIIEGYVTLDKSAQEIVDDGFPAEEVNRVVLMIDRNEYKRRQSPPGVRITPKAFGRDRRLPITNKFRTQARKK